MPPRRIAATEEKPPSLAHPLALVAALVALALTLLLVVWRLQPPAALDSQAPPDTFPASRARAVLEELLGPGAPPHPVGSANNDRVRERIVAHLEALDYTVSFQETTACHAHSGAFAVCARLVNVLARLPGQQDGPAVLLMAHYDAVAAGPGAADDMSGVASIIEIARVMREQGPYRNPVIFLFTDGEEIGLMGARAFVAEHPWARDVGVAINLEARGSSGQSLLFETSVDNAWLIAAFARSAPRPATSSLQYETYRLLPNDTDLTVFKNAGIPSLNFAFIEDVSHYHTPLDNLESLDPGSLQHQGDNVLALAQELAMLDLSNPPAGNAVYMDMLNLGILRWPAAWTIPLAVFTLLLYLGTIYRLIRQRQTTIGALLWGVLTAFLSLLLPILLGLGLSLLVGQVIGAPPGYAYPLPLRAALWAGALLCGGLMATAFSRRAGFWGLGMGAWFFWSLLALIVSLTLVGAAVVVLVAALCAALLTTILVYANLYRRPWLREGTFILAAVLAGITWLQLALQFEYAVSFELSPSISLSIALLAGTLAPLFALPKGQTGVRKGLLLGSIVLTVAGTVLAMWVPPFSESHPQPLNLYHLQDHSTGESYWASLPWRGTVPEPLRQQFDPEPQAVLPWSDQEFLVAQAPFTNQPPPDFVVLSEQRTDEGRTVEIELRSSAGAGVIELNMPLTDLAAITAAGEFLPVDPEVAAWNDVYTFACYGLACDRFVLTLQLRSADPIEVFLVEYSPGLPPGGERLLEARPAWAVPAQNGDMSIVLRRMEF